MSLVVCRLTSSVLGDDLPLVLAADLPVELEELGGVHLGGLEELHLADEHVVDGVDPEAALLDLLADVLGDELLHKVLQLAGGGLAGHDLDHPLADPVHAGALRVHGERVPGAAHGVGLSRGEGDAEHADEVPVSGLHLGVGLDEGLPLLDEGLQAVVGEVHPVERGEAVVALHLLHFQLDLPVAELLVVVEVSEVELEDTASEPVGGDLETDGLGHAGLAGHAVAEDAGGDDVVPLLAKEGVGLSLGGLARGSFVLAYGHCWLFLIAVAKGCVFSQQK